METLVASLATVALTVLVEVVVRELLAALRRRLSVA
jgi:hypothetical protein